MSAGLSKYTAALRSKPLSEYAWWKHHVLFFSVLLLGLPMVLTFFYGLAGLYSFLGIESLMRTVANLCLYAIFVIAFVTAVGSFVGYYYDARYVDDLDTEWSPRWWAYMVVHLLPVVGPLIAVPLYVAQRFRYVGLPLTEFR